MTAASLTTPATSGRARPRLTAMLALAGYAICQVGAMVFVRSRRAMQSTARHAAR